MSPFASASAPPAWAPWRACVPFAAGLRATCLRATVFELLLRQRAALCASASAPSSWAPCCASASALPAWVPCSSTSSGSVRRHVQVLQLRQRGHRARAPLAAACGAMCKCFSVASVGTVFEPLLRQRAAPCASASAPPAWAPCFSTSNGFVRRHMQVLLLRQRGHLVRAPLAAMCGTVCRCFSSASVGIVSEFL